MKWVLGCGFGCLAIAIIGIGGIGIAGYFGYQKTMEVASKEFAKSMQEEYAKAKAAQKVPAENAALFDEMIAQTQAPETTMWAGILLASGVMGAIDDSTVTPEEITLAESIRDFIKQNPNCSMLQMSKFVEQHPELETMAQRLQQQTSGSQSLQMTPYEMPPMPSELPPPAESPAVPSELTPPADVPEEPAAQ